jgi:PAS domain S-box-containing protein
MSISGDQARAGVTRPRASNSPRPIVAPGTLDGAGPEPAAPAQAAPFLRNLQAQLQAAEADLRRARVDLASVRQELDRLREAGTALQTTEARLGLAMRAANIGFWDWHIPTNTVFHSPEWKRQLGFDDDEVTNAIEEWQSRLHPEDKDRVQQAVAEFMQAPKSGYDMEFRLRHRDGSYRWIHSQGVLILDAAGQPTRLLGVHVDVTGSKQRETELRESEQRFRRLVETTHIIPWEANPETWRFTYAGPRSPMILGYPLEEWFQEDFWAAHLHPEDRVACVTFRREQARQHQDFESEYRMLAADGHTVWFHDVVHVVNGPAGPEKLQGFLVDVTEQKRAAEEHGRLAAIVASSNDAIIGETLDGNITSWNKSAERIYGYPAADVLGRSVRMLVPRERAEEVAEILERIKRGEMIEHFETLRVRKDGRQIQVSLVVSPIRDAMGKITGASAIARDITERKQLEAEVLQISEREQQRIAQDLHDGLGQLLSGTVHFTNVLQLELAEQALPEAAEALRIIDLLKEAVGEARSLARGLYPVRPESNGLMVALQELASRTKELFSVPCELRCGKPVLITDNAAATHLYRIAQEAITNALKHGQARHIRITLTANSQRIVLTVRDDGTGFPQPPSPRRGMGIRIMQYRASMIGGTLTIQSKGHRGVTVLCTLLRHGPGLLEGKSV